MNEKGDSRREEGEGVERGKGETGRGEEEMGEVLSLHVNFQSHKMKNSEICLCCKILCLQLKILYYTLKNLRR